MNETLVRSSVSRWCRRTAVFVVVGATAAMGCRSHAAEESPTSPSEWAVVIRARKTTHCWNPATSPPRRQRCLDDLWERATAAGITVGNSDFWLAPSGTSALVTGRAAVDDDGTTEEHVWIARRTDAGWTGVATVRVDVKTRWVSWSSDSGHVAVNTIDPDSPEGERSFAVRIVDVSSGAVRLLPLPRPRSQSGIGFALSPDGSRLALANTSVREITVYGVRSGDVERTLPAAAGADAWRVLAWPSNGDVVYQVGSGYKSTSSVVGLGPDGKPRYRVDLEEDAIPRAVRPDGGALYYSVGRQRIPARSYDYRIVPLGSTGDASALGRRLEKGGGGVVASWVKTSTVDSSRAEQGR